MEYNERIKQYRLQKGCTQQQLADEVGASRQSVMRWENGWIVPSMYYAARLADYFGVTVSELMTGAPESEPSLKTDNKLRTKCIAATIKFCLSSFLPVVIFTIISNLVFVLRYYLVQSNGYTQALQFMIKSIFEALNGLVAAILIAELVYWITKLVSWLAGGDGYLSYRIYKPWSIGFAVWLVNALTAVFLVYANYTEVFYFYFAAVLIAAPICFVTDFAIKKALGKRMVVPHNKTLKTINLVFVILASICVICFAALLIYMTVKFSYADGSGVAVLLMFFCFAAAAIEILYIIVRIAVYFAAVRKNKQDAQ